VLGRRADGGAMTYGKQNGRLVACGKSRWHGFHPEHEDCPECPPPSPTTKKTYDYGYSWSDVSDWYTMGFVSIHVVNQLSEWQRTYPVESFQEIMDKVAQHLIDLRGNPINDLTEVPIG